MATTFAIAAFLPPDRRSLESQTPLRMIVECKVVLLVLHLELPIH